MLGCGGGRFCWGFKFSDCGFCGVAGRRRAGRLLRTVSAVEEGLGLLERSVRFAEP